MGQNEKKIPKNIFESQKKKNKNPTNHNNKIAKCKINIQESFASLYASNEKLWFEMEITIPFTITFLKEKCLGKSQNLYGENY